MPRSDTPPESPPEKRGRMTLRRSRRVATAQSADRNHPSPTAPCATPPQAPPSPKSDGLLRRGSSCGRRKRRESKGGWAAGGAAGSRKRLAGVGPKSGSRNRPAVSRQSARCSSPASDSPSSRSGTLPPILKLAAAPPTTPRP